MDSTVRSERSNSPVMVIPTRKNYSSNVLVDTSAGRKRQGLVNTLKAFKGSRTPTVKSKAGSRSQTNTPHLQSDGAS